MLILLHHRPFATYAKFGPGANTEVKTDFRSLIELSKNVCFENAVRIASIFKQLRENFSSGQNILANTQHAGTAAIALLSGIPHIRKSDERKQGLDHLQCLLEALQILSKSCPPAERLVNFISQSQETLIGIS